MTVTLDLSRWSDPQRRAIEARGHNVLVSAGAGSGKTSVLVERVVRCLTGTDGVDVTRLLVVTFTEAAAGEMRKRIVDRLQTLVGEARDKGETADIRWLNRQIQWMEQAQISTLHSFCMQVVRRNFLHLGIEPRFDLLTEDDALLIRSALLEDLVEQRLKDEPNHGVFHDMMIRFAGGKPSALTTLVYRLDGFARSQPQPTEWLETMRQRFDAATSVSFADLSWTDAFFQWITRRIEQASMAFKEGLRLAAGQEELSSYEDNLAELCGWADTAMSQLNSVEGIEAATASLGAALSAKSPRAKDHPEKERVRDCRGEGLELLKTVHQVLGRGIDALRQDIEDLAPHVGALVDLVEAFQSAYESRKRADGVLDFQDLEHLAYRAIRERESGEARRLQDQYAEIFVDEYQDTSPIQDAIVQAIASREGNVFVVGDVKQSIYRFRMAEPNLFLGKYRTLGVDVPGEVIDLVANYRSRASVVDAVNFFFQQLFSVSFGGIDYDDKTQMRAGARYGDSEAPNTLAGPVEVHLIERNQAAHFGDEHAVEAVQSYVDPSGLEAENEDGPGIDDASSIEKEAWVIAERIRELMGLVDGHSPSQVWDAKLSTYRPLQYRDIVVLLRSVKSRMNTVLDVFRRVNIPAYGATSTGFYGSLEVQWLLSALAVIDNPRREIDLAVLMRSPMGNFSDEDLARIRCVQKGNFFEVLRVVGAMSTMPDSWLSMEANSVHTWGQTLIAKVRSFLQRLQSWRTLSRRAQTEEVMRRILDDTGLNHYVGGMKGGRVRQGNIQVLLDKARSFDRTSFDGVYGFVTRARKALAHEVDVGEARTLGEHEDVVRVMTIHQSKGLEYPVVFVADVGKMFYRDADERAFPLHRDLGFGPQRTDPATDQRWHTMASLAIDEADVREFLAEEARVLYVAMTRARERLILVGSARQLARRASKAADAYNPLQPCLPVSTMLRAKSYLDWILTTLVRHQDGNPIRTLARDGGWSGDFQVDAFYDHPARFDVTLWNQTGGRDLPVPDKTVAATGISQDVLQSTDIQTWLDALRMCLPEESEASTRKTPDVILLDDVEQPSVPGKVSATELRRLWTAKHTQPSPQRTLLQSSPEHLLEDPEFVRGEATSGRESGIAFHAIMQHLNVQTEPTESGVRAALDSLVKQRKVKQITADAVDVEEIVAFLRSDLGQRLAKAKRVLREQPFFYRIPLESSDGGKRDSVGDMNTVVVQGVIDCLAEEEDGWMVIDYKTDRVQAAGASAKAQEYAAQLSTYVEVAKTLLPAERISAYIYFVKPRTVIPMEPVAVRDVF